jgi:hypothetical protein
MQQIIPLHTSRFDPFSLALNSIVNTLYFVAYTVSNSEKFAMHIFDIVPHRLQL